MSLSAEGLRREAGKSGFRPEILEKIDRLLELLEAVRRHPFLKSRVALKGGTALNLFVFNVPRLSVDIDLNYIGELDRESMLAERRPLEQAIEAVAGRLGLVPQRTPDAHAGGKWRLRYDSVLGQGGTLEMDINYMYRTPLWEVGSSSSTPIGELRAREVPILDVHELAGGKLAALLSRGASRDLFDAHQLLARYDLDTARLRTAFVLYGAMNRRDWRTVSVDDIQGDPRELRNQLLPTLRSGFVDHLESPDQWARSLVDECRDALTKLLPLRTAEMDFLDGLLNRGEIRPQLLEVDTRLAEIIRRHPALLWKAHNVTRMNERPTNR